MEIKAIHSEFLYSVPKLSGMKDYGLEICVMGRSNVGKSSLINALCQKKGLAHTSKLPGRTRHAVSYSLALAHSSKVKKCTLIDLPGYGYAQMAKSMAMVSQQLLFAYVAKRENLQVIFLLLDIRRDMDKREEDIITLAHERKMPIILVLTKCDKIAPSKRQEIMHRLSLKSAIDHDNIIMHSTYDALSQMAMRKKLYDLL